VRRFPRPPGSKWPAARRFRPARAASHKGGLVALGQRASVFRAFVRSRYAGIGIRPRRDEATPSAVPICKAGCSFPRRARLRARRPQRAPQTVAARRLGRPRTHSSSPTKMSGNTAVYGDLRSRTTRSHTPVPGRRPTEIRLADRGLSAIAPVVAPARARPADAELMASSRAARLREIVRTKRQCRPHGAVRTVKRPRRPTSRERICAAHQRHRVARLDHAEGPPTRRSGAAGCPYIAPPVPVPRRPRRRAEPVAPVIVRAPAWSSLAV